MNRVIIVPVSEIGHFPGMTAIARGGTIAALLGDSFESRSRSAFGSDDEFFDAVARGRADLYTFSSAEAAIEFARTKVESLNAEERRIVEAMTRIDSSSGLRKLPQSDDTEANQTQMRA